MGNPGIALRSIVMAAVVAAASLSVPAAADSPFGPGLRIIEGRSLVRPGGTVRARVLWERSGEGIEGGRVALRWILRAEDGTILSRGRRRRSIDADAAPPHRFSLRARVPADAPLWSTATLEVAVERSLVTFDTARTRIRIAPGRFVRARPSSVEVREGVLGVGSTGFPTIQAAEEGGPGPFHLVGPVVAEVLRHPEWVGARVRVEGRRVGQTGLAYIPEAEPLFLRARGLEWLDPPPERLLPAGGTGGDYEPPPPPGAYEDEESYRAYLEDTRRPGVAESEEDLTALRAEFGHRIDGLPAVDFAESRVVVVTAGHCPNPLFVVSLGDAWYDERAGRTVVTYDAIELHLRGPTFGVTTRPWVAAVLPRRPGPVEFRRREWVADLPGSWPPTPAY